MSVSNQTIKHSTTSNFNAIIIAVVILHITDMLLWVFALAVWHHCCTGRAEPFVYLTHQLGGGRSVLGFLMSRSPSYVGQMTVEFAQVVVVFSVLHGWEDGTAGQLRQILHRQRTGIINIQINQGFLWVWGWAVWQHVISNYYIVYYIVILNEQFISQYCYFGVKRNKSKFPKDFKSLLFKNVVLPPRHIYLIKLILKNIITI